ncbi:hypothetical protein CAEBREN_06219 [Caenorhabditis brenneri]|uniref:SCP domain-containing protein n=1 Tax=Caenorhabditis brenneri TaxID=135651 RepID=G0MR72_CAEBE|nr:hypothetical protein CAEBREN_06219 [Caenorhabditis brenneri]
MLFGTGRTFLLLIIVECSHTSPIPIQTGSSRIELLNSLNEFRARFANAARISNMNELTYSLAIEKMAKNYSCDLPRDAETLMYYLPVGEKFENDFIKYSAAHKEDVDGLDALFGVEDYFYSVLRSLHSEVGCAHLAKPSTAEPMTAVKKISNIKEFSFNTICLFGPKAPPSTLERMYGTPGTNCYRGKNENGLCKKN